MSYRANMALNEFGTYAKLVPDSATKNKITTIINQINIENPLGPNSLHTTVVYSRVVCDSIIDIDVQLPIVACGVGFDLFSNQDGSKCLVLRIDSPYISELHDRCRNEYGASHDFPQFNPHITLSYDYQRRTVPNEAVLDYFNYLVFDRYVVEPLIF